MDKNPAPIWCCLWKIYIQQQLYRLPGHFGGPSQARFFDGVIGLPKTRLYEVCFPCYLAFVAATGCGPTRVQSRLVFRKTKGLVVDGMVFTTVNPLINPYFNMALFLVGGCGIGMYPLISMMMMMMMMLLLLLLMMMMMMLLLLLLQHLL